MSYLTFLWDYVFGLTSFAEPTLHSTVICASRVRLALIPGPQTDSMWPGPGHSGLSTPLPHIVTDRDGRGTLPTKPVFPRPYPELQGRDVTSSGPRFHEPGRSDATEDHFYLRTKSRQPASRSTERERQSTDKFSRMPQPQCDDGQAHLIDFPVEGTNK